MPSAERYAQYRADQTTIWVTKRAAEFLARERAAGESTAGAVDRLLTELRSLRRRGSHSRSDPNVGSKVRAKAAPEARGSRGGRRAAKGARSRTGSRVRRQRT
jgi:hypothetical protein